MLADVELLVQLQGLDLRAGALRKEIALLPQEITAIEKTLMAHAKRLEADRSKSAAKQRERKLIDLDIQAQNQKIAKLKEQMSSVKNNEQYRAFQSEIAYCEQAIKTSEDRVLELMTDLEVLDAAVKLSEANLKEEKQVVEGRKSEALKSTAGDEAKLAAITAEREALIVQLSRVALTQYEKLSKRYPGSVIADATLGQCSACQLTLRPQLFQDVRKRDRLLNCENCKRLLHYNPAIVVDPPPPPPPAATRTRASSARASASRTSAPSLGGTRVDMT